MTAIHLLPSIGGAIVGRRSRAPTRTRQILARRLYTGSVSRLLYTVASNGRSTIRDLSIGVDHLDGNCQVACIVDVEGRVSMLFDMPLDELQGYRPEPTRRTDFAAFWSRTLAEAGDQPLNAELVSLEYPVSGLRVASVRYDGWRGARIAGYYLARAGARDLPALVVYHGYSGNKGYVHEYLGWALQGYAVLAVDVRGQSGQSTDPGSYSSGHLRGWLTQGILAPDEYYYRGVYVDCLRALDVVAAQPEVDPERIGITGISQGGGLTLAVAALDSRPKLAMADIPFLCHFRRAVELVDRDPYLEIANYCKLYPEQIEQVFTTLSYIDVLNLAERITCPVLLTVGLQDLICPPSTVFAVYNHLTAPKDLAIFPFTGHEPIPAHHVEKLKAARRILTPGSQP